MVNNPSTPFVRMPLSVSRARRIWESRPKKDRRVDVLHRLPAAVRRTVGIARRRPPEMFGTDAGFT